MNGTKVTLKHGSGKPSIGSLAKAELAVDLDNLELWTCKTDGGNPEKISGKSDSTDGNDSDNAAQIEINKGDIADNAAQIEINKGDISDNAAQIEINKGDIAGNSEQIEINKGNIADNAAQIEINKNDIAGNAAQIEINKNDIADNAAQIEINKGNIADNAVLIEANSGDIANNAAQIKINKDNIAEHEVEINANSEAIDTLDVDAVKKSVTTVQEMVGDLKAKSFEGDGSKLSGITTDQLADVNSAGAVKDDLLIYNGSSWIAEGFAIDTELTYQGAINLTVAITVTPVNGDLYINDTDGVVHSSWVGIAGVTVRAGNVIGYATKNARWYLLGDIASSSVTDVEGGSGIDVDDSKPAQPVVSIDRAEVDTWYEPKFNKLSAFNKNFGTTAGTVSEGNHVHNQYITTETDPTVPAHVKSISTADIAKWNTPAPVAPVSSVNGKTGAVVLAHGDVGAAPASHTHSEYSPTSHNHNGVYQPAGSYAAANHNHSGVYAPASHTHAYVPLSGNSTIAGVLTATDLTITSDERLKSDVETLDPLKVYGMRGVSYTLEETGESSSGVIAQEMAKVAPELVISDHHGYLSVAYPKLVGYLIEAIKSQKEEIDELRRAIEGMR